MPPNRSVLSTGHLLSTPATPRPRANHPGTAGDHVACWNSIVLGAPRSGGNADQSARGGPDETVTRNAQSMASDSHPLTVMHHHVARSGAERTLGEIRDARIANGIELEQVALRSRIPLALVEALERGELSRWPRALYGRTQLVRYARAAGLDPDWVVNAVMPLLEEPASAEALPEPQPASGSDGRIAIIASTFDKDEELFAPEDGGPQTAAPAGQRATVARPECCAHTSRSVVCVCHCRCATQRVGTAAARATAAAEFTNESEWAASWPILPDDSHRAGNRRGAALRRGALVVYATTAPDDVHARRTPGRRDLRHDRAHRAPGDRDVRGCARGPGNASAVAAARGTSGARHRELGSTDSRGSCRCEDRSSIQAAGSAARSNRCSRHHSGGGRRLRRGHPARMSARRPRIAPPSLPRRANHRRG